MNQIELKGRVLQVRSALTNLVGMLELIEDVPADELDQTFLTGLKKEIQEFSGVFDQMLKEDRFNK